MRCLRYLRGGALSGMVLVQAMAQTPLTYHDILARARPTTEQWRMDSRLAEWRGQLQETRGFLREGPTLSLDAGPRRSPGFIRSTDKGVELELPLFLSPKVRSDLERSLGQAHPLMLESASREAALRIKFGYLEAWQAQRLLALRETDLATVERWLQATQTRAKTAAEPDYQVALVEGERLKAQQELDEARTQVARTWAALVGLADLPTTPVPLADPGAIEPIPEDNIETSLHQGPLRAALLAQVELEERSLRLKASQSLSRWNLRGSYSTEYEDRITRLGVAVRLPRPGEAATIRESTDTQIRVLQGEYRQSLAELDARILGVVYRFQKASAVSPVPDFTRAIQEVGQRLEEGKDQPSEAFPIRRQLLEAQMAALRRIQARHAITAEIQYLLP